MRLLMTIGLLILTSLPIQAAPMSARDMAVQEATAFLGLLDRQRFSDAWSAGDYYFKTQLTVKKWRSILRAYRVPLGRVTARRRIAARHQDRFESAPRGLYVEVEFRSTFGRFERKERVVVHKDYDGRWRITSYQLR